MLTWIFTLYFRWLDFTFTHRVGAKEKVMEKLMWSSSPLVCVFFYMPVKYSTVWSHTVLTWLSSPQVIFKLLKTVSMTQGGKKIAINYCYINNYFLARLLFLIKNMFKGYLNNLNSCVGNKQKLTVCITVETYMHLGQMCCMLYMCRHARQNLCTSV